MSLPFDAGAFDAVNGSDQRAAGADDGLGGEIVGKFEDVDAGAKVVKLGVAAEKVGRFVAAIADAVGAAMRAARGLFFFGAVIALAAGGGGGPRDAIADRERLARPILVEAGTELLDATDGFMAENDRELIGSSPFQR